MKFKIGDLIRYKQPENRQIYGQQGMTGIVIDVDGDNFVDGDRGMDHFKMQC